MSPITRRAVAAARRLGRGSARGGSGRSEDPRLSVVIPVHNVAAYLPECLDSVLGQSLTDLEVIAVDDGSTDTSLAILHDYAARDPRLRVLTQANSGQGIARNVAVEAARGEFLTFCDADDTIPLDAYEHMVRTLEASGSDFTVGTARRFTHSRVVGRPWGRTVHEYDRFSTTIDEFPVAIQDIIACNRMLRTAFWREKVPPFRGHIAYEDHVPMLAAYVRASRFDVLSRVTYNWRVREDNTSTSQQKASITNLLDRIEVKEEAHEMLLAEASPVVYDAWIARTLGVDFPPFITAAAGGTDMYRSLLSATYRTFLARAGERSLAGVDHAQKVRGWLCAHERWAQLAEADEHFRDHGLLPRAHVRSGRICAVPEEGVSFFDDLPGELLELAGHETSLMAGLRSVERSGEDLAIRGYALIRGLDCAETVPTVEAWLVDALGERRVRLAVHQESDPEVNVWTRLRNASYDNAAFVARVELASLAPETLELPATWVLRLRVTQDGITREGGVYSVVDGSPAGIAEAIPVDLPGRPPLLVVPQNESDRGLTVRISCAAAAAQTLEEPDGDRLSGRLRDPGGAPRTLEIHARHDRRPDVIAPVRADGSFAIELPPGIAGDWKLVALRADGQQGEVRAPVRSRSLGRPGPGRLSWVRTPQGGLVARSDAREVLTRGVRLEQDAVVVEVEHPGVDGEELLSARLELDGVTTPAEAVVPGDGTSHLRFPKRVPTPGAPRAMLPVGGHGLLVTTRDGRDLRARPASELAGRLPWSLVDDDLRVTVRVRPRGDVRLLVAPPLSDHERTPAGQRTLQRRHRLAGQRPAWVLEDSVFLQSGDGRTASDSQRALDAELARSRPDLVRYWGVRDRGVDVPSGAVAVLVGSAQWYDVVGAARYLCANSEPYPSWVKRPHQRSLQTLHGYPFKSVGRALWHHRQYDEHRITLEVARTNQQWDAIVVPDDRAAVTFQRQYDFRGALLPEGLPGSDDLVTADRDVVRRRVLADLGVPLDRTVVLWAPTYREPLNTHIETAEMFKGLDLARLQAGLGPDHVVLLRGHPRNGREASRLAREAGVIDVTGYPEINHLMLASDLAIFDYSSLRFGWGLIGRPAVFFVPDLETYLKTRPALLDYGETAPGPVLRTTDDLIDALRDPAIWTKDHDLAREEFNRRFNSRHDGHCAERVVEAFFCD